MGSPHGEPTHERTNTMASFDSPWKLRMDVEAALDLLVETPGIRAEVIERLQDAQRRGERMLKSNADRLVDIDEDITMGLKKGGTRAYSVPGLREERKYTAEWVKHLRETLDMIAW